MMGRPRLLNESQADDLRRRYQLFKDNKPSKLWKDFGISPQAMRHYLKRRHKG